MFNAEQPFFDSESDNVAMLSTYYNQLNRFPFLPLGSSMAAMPSQQQQQPFGTTPFSVDELARSFPTHPSMPPRRMSSSSTASADSNDLCMPTSSLFFPPPNFADLEMSPSPSPTDMDCGSRPTTSGSPFSPITPIQSPTSTISQSAPASQAAAPPLVKKTRAPPRERISTKDFKPPDVTGLSKREARLVKNRAAAFLSRQRKREEFEEIQVRVVELEKENARLIGQLRTGGSDSGSNAQVLQSEISSMRSKLASSEQRAAELRDELAQLRSLPSPTSPTGLQFPPVKRETLEFGLDRSPSPTSSDSSGGSQKESQATRLGMMVLMSLSTLFSNAASGAPTSKFTISSDALPPVPARPDWEVLSQPSDAEFDVSFVAAPQDGKVRVRLSMPGAAAGGAWEQPLASPTDSLFSFDLPSADMLGHGFDAPFAMEQLAHHKKRLRISSKSARGGEWDVEVC